MSGSLTEQLGNLIKTIIMRTNTDTAQYIFSYSSDFGEEYTAEVVIRRVKTRIGGNGEE